MFDKNHWDWVFESTMTSSDYLVQEDLFESHLWLVTMAKHKVKSWVLGVYSLYVQKQMNQRFFHYSGLELKGIPCTSLRELSGDQNPGYLLYIPSRGWNPTQVWRDCSKRKPL